MKARGLLFGMALAGVICLGAEPAAAQELQAGEMMTQSEADRLEAVQADLDRIEAEEADELMRDEERRRRRRRREDRDERSEEQADLDREEYEDWSTCLARLPEQQATMIRQILAGHEATVQSLRDSAGDGADVPAAIEQQRVLRDQLIAAIAGETCG